MARGASVSTLQVMAAAPDIVIREIRPDDRERIEHAAEYTSDESYYRRFHGPHSSFSTRELAYLTEVDGVEHFAVVATEREDPDKLVAVARYIRDPQSHADAELAVMVHDPYQRHGVGRRMLERLADEARHNGVERLHALIQGDNYAMTSLLLAVFPHARIADADWSQAEYIVDL